MVTLAKVQIVQVPPEQRAEVEGATHACKHIADKLNNGEAVVPGKDFGGRMQPGEWAATCRMCAEYLYSLAPKVLIPRAVPRPGPQRSGLLFAVESSIASRARVEIRRWPPARGIRKMGARGEE